MRILVLFILYFLAQMPKTLERIEFVEEIMRIFFILLYSASLLLNFVVEGFKHFRCAVVFFLE